MPNKMSDRRLAFCFFLSVSYCVVTSAVPVDELIKKFSKNDQLDAAQTEKLFESIGIGDWSFNGSSNESCSSSQYFHRVYSKNDGSLNKTDLNDFCPAVLLELSKESCQRKAREEKEKEEGGNEDAGKAWGFGILFVTIISFGSLLGAVVVPFMNTRAFQTILMAMISLAVGVLSGSGIFHLIPHALKLGHKDLSYMWKLVMVTVGIYIFFLLESGMKMILHFRALNWDPNSNERKVKVYADNGHGHSNHLPSEPGGISYVPEKFPKKTPNGVCVLKTAPERKQIATVAWMILIGDGLHNFIDGLAIGVSCSTSVLSGLATSLAICCEELPHELGDFAILLNSGMTYKQAMLGNFISACFCYLGLIVGLILGFKTSAVHYIYGLAGGMFLYISLVDMLPESLQMIQSLSGRSKKKAFKMFLIQNFAILFGMSAMLLLSFYTPKIKQAKF